MPLVVHLRLSPGGKPHQAKVEGEGHERARRRAGGPAVEQLFEGQAEHEAPNKALGVPHPPKHPGQQGLVEQAEGGVDERRGEPPEQAGRGEVGAPGGDREGGAGHGGDRGVDGRHAERDQGEAGAEGEGDEGGGAGGGAAGRGGPAGREGAPEGQGVGGGREAREAGEEEEIFEAEAQFRI